ncbi:MAG: hypothetical protein JXB46_06240, partial [Candidatus Eisenbacteria bacterium]|nr:hypothetical protein [Candidatus Eisenbacteria bacterium]
MRRGKAAALLAVSVVLAQLVVGCSTARDETIRIPFEFYRGKFRFPAEVNGAPCSFTLDNGILWEEVLLFGSPRIDAMGLDLTDQVSLGAATAD